MFQVTGSEIEPTQKSLDLTSEQGFDRGRVQSFLFLAAQLRQGAYPRVHLAETVRAVNRLFKMPVIVLFRHGATLTLAAIHRRVHKRDDNRDVLERVTLVKDIRLENPHRAHIEILADLALERLMREGVRNFDDLHLKWEQKLDIEALNKRFYKKLFEWFERAVQQCRFPDDNAGDGCIQRHVIRLITRLLFIWFLKEKGLVPESLFDEQFARECLKEYKPESTDYYRAVIQNLFFATLNTEIDRRGFNGKGNAKSRDFSKYRYRKLLRAPDEFVKLLKQVPFVNGGLFDCLDDFSSAGTDGSPIDAFTDSIDTEGRGLHVPADLLLNQANGLFALLRQHKFTVEENTPLDTEVALDPELLGRVFENLLAAYNPETRESARKATGSYYTPRPVVDYMVREVLSEALASKSQADDGDVEFWRERINYLLDHSAAMDDASDLFSEPEKSAIVTAIAELRTLDPAVGSGAFPMGILQTLTLALRRLDSKNALWESFQKERAANRAGQAFDTAGRQQRDRELEEISATFDRYRKTDFGRKLYLIQNGIYGVDVQPIACQIAKLRFFISLVIEQTPDPALRNLGIKPLPNLETQLVAADSLLDLKSGTTDLLHEDALALKQKEVASVRERYFLAGSRPRKLECIRVDKHLRNELRELLEQNRGDWIAAQERDIDSGAAKIPNADTAETYRQERFRELAPQKHKYDEALAAAHMISEWDPYDQNVCATWFNAEYMFGVDEGFDVVIGNPPYIQLQANGGLLRRRYQSAGYETFASTGDIYQLFFERGCGLLSPDIARMYTNVVEERRNAPDNSGC
ncbi:MAG: Eco57I restriction-modification methylase domain-containing protein [Gammaproteobacteria bacterium]|nr:Eco57I restriction-modification methylase domain-containing protein [Gammaproteobacteria bacterium]